LDRRYIVRPSAAAYGAAAIDAAASTLLNGSSATAFLTPGQAEGGCRHDPQVERPKRPHLSEATAIP